MSNIVSRCRQPSMVEVTNLYERLEALLAGPCEDTGLSGAKRW